MKITKKTGGDVLKVDNVELNEPTVGTLIAAERISGKSSGFEFLAAAISQVGTFDGKPLPPEEIRRLSSSDFLELVAESGLVDMETLPDGSSTLPGKENSDITA